MTDAARSLDELAADLTALDFNVRVLALGGAAAELAFGLSAPRRLRLSLRRTPDRRLGQRRRRSDNAIDSSPGAAAGAATSCTSGRGRPGQRGRHPAARPPARWCRRGRGDLAHRRRTGGAISNRRQHLPDRPR